MNSMNPTNRTNVYPTNVYPTNVYPTDVYPAGVYPASVYPISVKSTTENTTFNQLLIYFDCDCPSNLSIAEEILENRYDINKVLQLAEADAKYACTLLNTLAATTLL